MTTKSCSNCKHLAIWDYPATREDPGDSGWECKHEKSVFWDDFTWDYTPKETDAIMEGIAAQCPVYEYFDWQEQHRQEAASETYFAALEAHLEASQTAELAEMNELTAMQDKVAQYFEESNDD